MQTYRTKEYRAWIEMRRRCTDPKRSNYHLYGGRGITVCDQWFHSFHAFLADVGYAPSTQHSLDRIDPDGNYEPSNVRWASLNEQNNNRRYHQKAGVDGVTHTAAEWARKTGINPATLRYRLRNGMNEVTAVTTPSRGWRRQVSFNGVSHTVAEWSQILGIPESTIKYRLRNNIPIDKGAKTCN